MPVNALLGTANLVLQVVERDAPRAVVLCFGAEAADYRVGALPALSRRPPADARGARAAVGGAGAFFGAFGWTVLEHESSRPTTCSARSRGVEGAAGGEALLFTGDRDMFQCVGDRVTVLYPGKARRDGPSEIDADGVRERYGIEPGQVPDFIALRGDPSDGLPGAKGIGEKTAARPAAARTARSRALIASAGAARRPRDRGGAARARPTSCAPSARSRRCAPVELERPPDAPTDLDRAGGARAGSARRALAADCAAARSAGPSSSEAPRRRASVAALRA